MAQQRLVSDKSVLYDAQTQQSSILTAVTRDVTMEDIEGMPAYYNTGLPSGSVIVNVQIYADFGTENQMPINGFTANVNEDDWDNFYTSQSLVSTELFDQVMETALYYTQDNIPVMYGLSGSNWVYTNS